MLKTSPSYCPVGDLPGTNLFSISLGSCLPTELLISDHWHLLAVAVVASGPCSQDCGAFCCHCKRCPWTEVNTWNSQVTALMRVLCCAFWRGGVTKLHRCQADIGVVEWGSCTFRISTMRYSAQAIHEPALALMVPQL